MTTRSRRRILGIIWALFLVFCFGWLAYRSTELNKPAWVTAGLALGALWMAWDTLRHALGEPGKP
jgi:TRAP-type C4-dicarboxylate transport system permease small subunit